jgi:hypothetical protein
MLIDVKGNRMKLLDSLINKFNSRQKENNVSKKHKKQLRKNKIVNNQVTTATPASLTSVVSAQNSAATIDSFNKQPSTYFQNTRGYSFHTHKISQVATLGKIEIYAFSKVEFDFYAGLDLIINCSQVSISLPALDKQITGPTVFDTLRKHIITPEQLVLNWSDGEIFPVKRAFWQELYKIICEQGFKKIGFCCVGGHGRTGTAIVAFILSNFRPIDNGNEILQSELADVYCDEIVETAAQESYLEHLQLEHSRDNTSDDFPELTWVKPVVSSLPEKETADESSITVDFGEFSEANQAIIQQQYKVEKEGNI